MDTETCLEFMASVYEVVLAAAGSMYGAVLIERRLIGAGLVSFVLLGLAISKLTQLFAFSRAASAELPFEILLVNAVLVLPVLLV